MRRNKAAAAARNLGYAGQPDPCITNGPHHVLLP
jgi:hypothetical protein